MEPPTPKPRTRFNCVKPDAQPQTRGNVEEITPNKPVAEQQMSVLSVYPLLDFSSPAPPKPPREGVEPPPRPPPPGWNLAQTPQSTAPLPPSPAPSQLNCSPPIREAPRAPSSAEKPLPLVPPRPLNLSQVVPADQNSEYATVNKGVNVNGEVSPTLIENPTYMSLAKFRQMANSGSNESGFISLSQKNGWSSDTDEIHSDEDSIVPSASTRPALPLNLLDLKPLPPVPQNSRKSFNDYTPPPKRDDYAFVSDFREIAIDAEPVEDTKSEDILLDSETEIEAEGEAVSFFGYVLIHVGKKERKRAHARLKNMHLSFHDDEETSDYLCGPFHLTGCQMISRFEDTISIRLNELETQKHVTFCVEDSKDTWSLLLSECWLTQHESLRSCADGVGITTCGTFYMRQGTAAQWQTAAAGLLGRTLHYVLLDSTDCIFELDIRKVISLREKVEKDQWCPLVKKKTHRGSFMMVLEGCTLYIECEDEWSTNLWFEVLQEVLSRPAVALDEYRLTGDNVPIIVDKCIRFISAYGMGSEGIYRRNGKISEAKDILTRLNKDAPGVHLKPANDETVYAVADVLRQYFRRLSTPLIPHEVQAYLFNIVSTQGEINVKCDELHGALQSIPLVNYNTLRKLISHLKDVTSNSAENRASVDNLAKVFGASLFHTESEAGPCFTENSNQISVIAMLIRHYDSIFELTIREELSREMIGQAQKMKAPPARADGLLVPIHIWEKENMPFNVKTDLAAEEVCREAVAKRGFDGEAGGKYALFEYIRDGVLSRRLADYERLSDPVINRWIPWKCTDGYLLFDRDNTNFDDIDNMSTYSGKVKVAEPGSKTFKSMELKVDEGQKVAAYKGDKRAREWSLDNTVWYLGAEPSRKAPYPYSATFFPADNADFSEKFVGFCVSFKASVERSKFLNQIFYLQYSGRPTPLVHI